MSYYRELAHRAVTGKNADDILAYAYSFYVPSFYLKKGVERSAKFLELSKLAISEMSSPLVRITGTNGKGSTAIFVESYLRAIGKETVCLTSPHIYSVRERIRLNGRAISWEQLGETLGWICPVLECMRGSEWHPHPTDLWIWAGFALYAAAPQATGVFEVSKGGGSDVINVFPGGLVGLTNIADDHLDEFGGSLKTLLNEKLGLCSPGSILCYNPLDGPLEQQLIDYCHRHGISTIQTEVQSKVTERGYAVDYEQSMNIALARTIVESLGIDLTRALDDLPRLSCRMDYRLIGGRRFLLDGAHNPAAMKRVVSQLDRAATRRIMVFGVQKGKDWPTLMQWVGRIAGLKNVICVPMITGDPVDAEALALEASVHTMYGIALAGMRSGLGRALDLEWEECIVAGSFKLFRDFDLALHALGYGAWAIPIGEIDPPQPWMRSLA